MAVTQGPYAGYRPTQTRRWRILFLDAYDSFSNNIVSLLKDVLGPNLDVEVETIDFTSRYKGSGLSKDGDYWQSIDAVVCGPGPGNPLCAQDVGAFQQVWNLQEESPVPVLGICLGFQSLVAHYGGKIRRLRGGLHGMIRNIEHRREGAGSDIFYRVPPFQATLYHSLCADIGQDTISERDWAVEKWSPAREAPSLLPLAWATEPRCDGDERILMAVRHVSKPLWGLQYHPESICTDREAHLVIQNWFAEALRWNLVNRASSREPQHLEVHPSPLNNLEFLLRRGQAGRDQTGQSHGLVYPSIFSEYGRDHVYSYRSIPLPEDVDGADVAEMLNEHQWPQESVILDSSSAKNGDPLASQSVIAIDVETALRFEHRAGSGVATVRVPRSQGSKDAVHRFHLTKGLDIWKILTHFWHLRSSPVNHGPACTFKGGFMGYITYEMGLHGISPESVREDRGHDRPDLCMIWVLKSVVLDHKAGRLHVQSWHPRNEDGQPWLNDIVAKLQSSPLWAANQRSPNGSLPKVSVDSKDPRQNDASRVDRTKILELAQKFTDPGGYKTKVAICQGAIKEGDSYELCLTAQTNCTYIPENHLEERSQADSPSTFVGPRSQRERRWALYRTLRGRLPAPFGSFIQLGGATLLSSSPERFLSHSSDGLCRMRPMKGTVRKSKSVSTLAQAEALLHIPKEEAENLMIVDLVRHDLHQVCGSGQVRVPELLKVEEYSSVFQMVSVVEGQLPRPSSNLPSTGFDVLPAALPPGSMTGAPKKRSCELLRGIEEEKERSLYSGVVGFMDVTGNGDWSVTIRSIFHWDGETSTGEDGLTRETWHIGAGGAVTALSTPEGEADEMYTKLSGPLGALVEAGWIDVDE